MTGFHHRATRSLRQVAHSAPTKFAHPAGAPRPVHAPLEGFVYAIPLGLALWALIGGAIAVL